MTGISEAFAAAIDVIASRIPVRPLPKGLNTCDAGEWSMVLNASQEPLTHDGSEVPPFTVIATHKQFLIICALAPDGGMIGGGMTESEFIADMKTLASGVSA